MNISDLASVIGIVVALGGAGGTGMKYYADNEYVTVASALFVQQQQLEQKIKEAEDRNDESAAAFYRGQLQQLKQQQQQKSFWQ